MSKERANSPMDVPFGRRDGLLRKPGDCKEIMRFHENPRISPDCDIYATTSNAHQMLTVQMQNNPSLVR